MIDKLWAFNDKDIQLNIEKVRQKVRNALLGANYLACIEVAFYVNFIHEEWSDWQADIRSRACCRVAS